MADTVVKMLFTVAAAAVVAIATFYATRETHRTVNAFESRSRTPPVSRPGWGCEEEGFDKGQPSRLKSNKSDLNPSSDNHRSKGNPCPICLESLNTSNNGGIVATPCGHLFCRECILATIRRASPRCPICSKKVNCNDLRNIYFS